MQTFLCQLLRGRNENQVFYYFSLLHDLLHRQELLNESFGRKLRFLSIFGKGISPGCFYCSNSEGSFKMTLELFFYQFPVYELSLLPGVFFQQLLLKLSNHINLEPALLIQERLRGVLHKFHRLN